MSNSYSAAVELNNQGVSMIESGDYSLAGETLKKALHLFKASCIESDVRCKADTPVTFRWSTSNILATDLQTDNSSGTCYVFTRALLVVPSQFSVNHCCYAESAALLYNLSLSFHIKGIMSNSSTLLEKALKAYKISLAICRRQKLCQKLQTDRLMEIAINNNMAMIYQEFMEFDRARICLVAVSRALRSLGNKGFLEPTEYQGLVLNLMMGRHEITLAAAA
jgi:hypothetical protein